MTNPVQEGVQPVAASAASAMHEITPEEIEALAHPNITVEESSVTIRSSPSGLSILVSVALYIIFMLILFHTGKLLSGEGGTSASIYGIAAVATLAFFYSLIRLHTTNVFDKLDRKVYRRNFVCAMASIDFDDIADVAMVDDMGPVFFKIALKANRYGKGVRITKNYPANSEEFLYLVMSALPAINGMLGDASEVEYRQKLAALAEHPVQYSREGSEYALTVWRSHIASLALGVFMLLCFVETDEGMRWLGLGIACFAFLCVFFLEHRIVIDTARKTISFSSILGWPKTTYSLDNYIGVRVTREHANGVYTHTSANLAFEGMPGPVNLYWSVWTKKLSAIVDETIAIIATVKDTPDDNTET